MSNGFGLDPIPGLSRISPDTAQLLVLNGPGAQRKFRLNQMRTLIGRDDPPHIKVDIDLTDCEIGNPPAVSRRHAEIQWVEGELEIVDLCSSNGTFVNDKELSPIGPNQPSAPVILKVGTKLKLGNLEFEVINYR
ncbi:MAG: FHA domain-containing protein [Microcoleus sp. CAN_BIN18]|nr:FHA domain-containing protein [Microcoleus sp. CAN_BIN18]